MSPALITAVVNGEPTLVPVGTTLAEVVAEWCPSERGVAVAVGTEVVPRSRWSTVVLEPGTVVEIVTAAAGG
jgi:sulfur carrier protein